MSSKTEIESMTYDREGMVVRIHYVNGSTMVYTHVHLEMNNDGSLHFAIAQGKYLDVAYSRGHGEANDHGAAERRPHGVLQAHRAGDGRRRSGGAALVSGGE